MLCSVGLATGMAFNLHSRSDFDFGFITGLMLLAAITKAATSITFIRHFKNKTVASNEQRFLFIACYVLNIIMWLIVAMINYGSIVENLSGGQVKIELPEIFALIAMTLFLITSAYLIIFDLQLRKILQTRQDVIINTIGQDITNA